MRGQDYRSDWTEKNEKRQGAKSNASGVYEETKGLEQKLKKWIISRFVRVIIAQGHANLIDIVSILTDVSEETTQQLRDLRVLGLGVRYNWLEFYIFQFIFYLFCKNLLSFRNLAKTNLLRPCPSPPNPTDPARVRVSCRFWPMVHIVRCPLTARGYYETTLSLCRPDDVFY